MEYFGNNSSGDANAGMNGYTNWPNSTYISYVCPGSGKYDVNELGVLALVSYGVTGHLRAAVYTTGGTFVMQGSAEMYVSETTETWKTHTSFVDQGGSAIIRPQLDGGTAYLLVVTVDATGNFLYVRRDTVTSGYTLYNTTDYTGGYPTSLPSGSNSSSKLCIRCGVTAATSSISIPVLQSSYRRRRF